MFGILKEEIKGSLPKGLVVSINGFMDSDYSSVIIFDISDNKSMLNINQEKVLIVTENSDYKRTGKGLQKRNSDIINKLKKYGIVIDWKNLQNGYLLFTIKESTGFKQGIMIKFEKNIYYTVHKIYDIVDAKIKYIEESLKIR